MSSSAPLASSSSSKNKSKSKESEKVAVEENAKSNEFIESSSESESESDDDSVDSEADIETVEPKKKKTQTLGGNGSRNSSLPKYEPPAGMSPAPLAVNIKDSPFEYDRLASNPSLQLWAIRVPLDLKTSRLSSLSVHPPTSTQGPSGSYKHKSSSYKLVSAGQTTTSKAVVDELGRQPTAGPGAADAMTMSEEELRVEGGEEMSGGLRLLVPKAKQDGSLFVAPIPISHQLLLEPQVSADALAPTESTSHLPSYLSQSTTSGSGESAATPTKRPQPTHLLKFRNRAYGFDTPGPARTKEPRVVAAATSAPADKVVKDKKKRKSEGKSEASPRKKKSKA